MAKMSRAQWLYEYYAAIKREQDTAKLYVDITKSVLTSLLGLSIFGFEKDADGNDTDKPRVIPLSLICGNPHVLKSLMGQEGEPTKQTSATEVEDAAFEEMSRRMMADMDPLDDVTGGLTPQQLLTRHEEKLLGIKVLDDTVKVSVDSIEDA